MKTHVESAKTNSDFFRPCSNALSSSVIGDKMVLASITSVLRTSCPPAILWCVIAIVVATFKLMLFAGTVSHVSKEVHEPATTAPSLTNFDAATTVIFKADACFVSASIYHSVPYSVEFCPAPSMRVHSLEATARIDSSTTKYNAYDNMLFATDALAYPGGFLTNWDGMLSDHCEVAELFSGLMFYNRVSHDVNLRYRFAFGNGLRETTTLARPAFVI